MGNLLYNRSSYIINFFLGISFFAYSAGSIIHILLVIAVIANCFGIIQVKDLFN
jgi:hypothetical protein